MKSAFKFDVDAKGIGRLVFDLPNEKVNKFSLPVLEELEAIVDSIANKKDIKALVVTSGKPEIFIAGADLHAFEPAFKDPKLLENLIRSGHRIFSKIENLPFPSIALIQGVCLGGGLEFALGCTFRVVTDHPKTSLGLPEVTLGLIPGWGGTQRLPRLIGLTEALNMILSGKPVNAAKAYKLHLADAIVPSEFQKEKAEEFIDKVVTPEGRKEVLARRKRTGFQNWLLEGNPIGRQIVFSKAKKDVMSKTKGHYPAPLIALQVIKKTYGGNFQEGLETEIKTVIENANKGFAQSINLINLFFIQESLKKDAGGNLNGTKPLPVKSTGILGAGIMGSGIAWLLTNNDYPVRLKDINWDLLGKGFSSIYSLYAQSVKYKKLKPKQANLKFQHLSGTVNYSGFQNLDLVIEAAVENLDLKNKIYKELEATILPTTIVGSNTSSLTIAEMSKAFKNPERFVGMHFFNPVNKMPLVEIVRGPKTTPETVATAVEICRKIGKTPLVVGDCPGFLVNRIFVIGANEIMWMFQEGVPMERLEDVLLSFGMPMSPFLLSDEVGNDVSYHVSKSLENAYGERMHTPEIIQMVYENKLLGKKIGKGFYIYEGKSQKPNPEIDKILATLKPGKPHVSDVDIRDRVVLMMVNEASRCLEENIIESPGYLDMAMIMGTGFPPFRGGLLRYADTLGADYIVTKLKYYEGLYGPRFKPSQRLLDMQANNKKFYE